MKIKQGRISMDLRLGKNLTDTSLSGHSLLKKKQKNLFNKTDIIKIDPRPLHDKTYIAVCTRDLTFFLTKRGFDISLNTKFFKSPNSKDFFEVLFFLLNQVDKNFDFRKKIDENFSNIIREIKYPFVLPKGSRFTAVSPHLWPNLLAFLKWFVELLQYDSFIKNEKDYIYSMLKKKIKNLWDQLGDFYLFFLNGTKKECNFSKILFSIVKFKISQSKLLNSSKIKKLRKKFRIFEIGKKAFSLFFLLNRTEINKKKLFFQEKKKKKIVSFLIFFYNYTTNFKNIRYQTNSLTYFIQKFKNRKKYEKMASSLFENRCSFLVSSCLKKQMSFGHFRKYSLKNVLKMIFLVKILFLLNINFWKIYLFRIKREIFNNPDSKNFLIYYSKFFKIYFFRHFFQKKKKYPRKTLHNNLSYKKIKKLRIQFFFDFFEKKTFIQKKKIFSKKNDEKKDLEMKKKLKKLRKMEIFMFETDLFLEERFFYTNYLKKSSGFLETFLFKKYLRKRLFFHIIIENIGKEINLTKFLTEIILKEG